MSILDIVIRAIIAVVGVVLTWVVIPWIKSKLTAEARIALLAMIETAVKAAEQLFGAGRGEDKLNYAIKWLSDRGITLDSGELRALIESAVYQLKT